VLWCSDLYIYVWPLLPIITQVQHTHYTCK
jgi:hypothetical protein